MDITHLGHSCLLVQVADHRLLIDPGLFTPAFEDLRGLDSIWVTHQHVDHVDLDRLPALVGSNPGVRLFAEPSTLPSIHAAGLEATVLQPGSRVEVGDAHIDVVGGEHAVIHPEIARVGNVGLVVHADGGPRLFHPGDSYGTVPAGIDLLALPLTAPWTSVRETVAFARDVAAPQVLPIHDAIVSPAGRAVYLRVVGSLLPSSEIRDLAGAGRTTW